eukprot:scaffold6638_cov127-Cylindrotheca_fusiformis.AAC.2
MAASTYPDLHDPIDIVITIALFLFGAVSVGINKWPAIPQLTRRGGLFAYGKFADGVSFGISIPSRWGMMLLYLPSMCYAVVVYLYFRGGLTCVLSIIHFTKRVLECVFLHRYSGEMPLASTIFMSSLYIATTFALCYYSEKDDLATNKTYSSRTAVISIVIFSIGISGNFYHHYILATLRSPDDKTYKIPRGGLFEYVTAPHYLFELIGWFGMAYSAQHALTTFIAVDMLLYLADRAQGQTKWYMTHQHLKEKYPDNRKHLIPLVF